MLSRLQLASANRVFALTSHDGTQRQKSETGIIENAYYMLNNGCRCDKFVISSFTGILRTFYKPTLCPKYCTSAR